MRATNEPGLGDVQLALAQQLFDDGTVAQPVGDLLAEIHRLRRMVFDQQRAVAWLVAMAGGRVEIPPTAMVLRLDDAEVVTFDDPSGHAKVVELRRDGQLVRLE